MKLSIFLLVAVLVIAIAGFFAFNQYIYNQKQQGPKQNTTMENTNNANTNTTDTNDTAVQIIPISHATMVLHLGGQIIYTDPVGGGEAFKGQPAPNLILVTDIHGDHMDAKTLQAVAKDDTIVVVPQAVKDALTEQIPGTIIVMNNGEKGTQKGIEIEAIPMYNIPESATAFHTKGRGNGYVISAEGKRIYIAGDTSATPEMRALQNIDIAFVPMNLPYTMDVDEAAEGVLAFKPKVVHPYHYRGQDGLSDVDTFKQQVESKDPNIKVEILNFYPEQ